MKLWRICAIVATVLAASSMFILGATVAVGQTTWYVDDDAPNDPGPGDPDVSDPDEDGSAQHPFDAIQEGIDAAGDADTVLVLDGTYTGTGNKDLDFGGKGITVGSADGPDNCVIDCEDDGRGFYFQNGETGASIVDGFTITKAHVVLQSGAGICCYYSSPTIVNCRIIACVGEGPYAGFGGAVAGGNNSSPTLIDCTFSGNEATSGGALFVRGSTTVVNCVLSGNTALDTGGAISCSGNAKLINCTFSGNTAGVGGAVEAGSYGAPVLVNCILWGDSPDEIYDSYETVQVTYSDVQGGTDEPWFGQGCIDADPLFVDPDGADDDPNTWEDNDYHIEACSLCIDAGDNFEVPGGLETDLDGNDRFVDHANKPDTGQGTPPIVDMGAYEYQFDAGGPAIIGVSPATLHFWMRWGGADPDDEFLEIRNCGAGTLNWDIEIEDGCTWLEALPSSGDCTDDTDVVTVSADPSGLAPGVYTCVLDVIDDEATNSPQTVQVTLSVGVIYVDDDAPNDPLPGDTSESDPDENGSPDHPFDAIQEGIDEAIESEYVLVANGTYDGIGNRDLDFAGKAITVQSESGAQECVIDCEYDGRAFCFDGGESADAVVDGFTITKGSVYGQDGGAIYCSSSSPTIANCIITSNEAKYNKYTHTGGYGAGLYCEKSAPTITMCTIKSNHAWLSGGGMCNSEQSAPTLIDCVFHHNWAAIELDTKEDGGGMYNSNSSPTLINCIFAKNLSGHGGPPARDPHDGGGVCNDNGSDVNLMNCIFIRNWADNGDGGALANDNSSHAALTNCTLVENEATMETVYGGRGGGVCLKGGSTITVTNCILWGNIDADGEGHDETDQLYIVGGTADVTYSCIQDEEPDNDDPFGGSANHNIDDDPRFVDPDGPDDDPDEWEDNNYRLRHCSDCMDSADDSAVPPDEGDLDGDGNIEEPTPFDLDGNPRFANGNGLGGDEVDMGAYELQCAADLNDDGCVDHGDLGILLADWGCTGGDCPGDADCDGDTDHSDLGILTGNWGCGT